MFPDAEEIVEALIDGGAAVEDSDGNIHLPLADEDDEDDDEDGDEDEDDDEDEDNEEQEAEEGNEEPEEDEQQGDLAEATTTVLPAVTAEATAAQPAPQQPRTLQITRAQFIQLIMRNNGQNGLEQLFGLGDDEEEEEVQPRQRTRRTRELRPHPRNTYQPQPAGSALMESGSFGINDHADGLSRNTRLESHEGIRRKKKVATRVMQRELGLGSPGKERSYNRLVSQELLPSTKADTIINYDERCYSGQFSEDGNFFFSCSQDFRVRMYDTSNPYSWRHYKTVLYPHGSWTITDATLSPDNKYLAYSTMRHIVCLANTDPDTDSEPYFLDFGDMHGGGRSHGRGYGGRDFAVSDTYDNLGLLTNTDAPLDFLCALFR